MRDVMQQTTFIYFTLLWSFVCLQAAKNQHSAFTRVRRLSGSSTASIETVEQFAKAVNALQLFATPEVRKYTQSIDPLDWIG